MGYDKVIDSSQLDASLTYEAEKIRAKLGSSAQLVFDLENEKGFGDAIGDISLGIKLETTTVATVASEITMRDYFAANPLPLKYASGIVFVFFNGDTVPTQGSRTYAYVAFAYHDSTERDFMITSYTNSLSVPGSGNWVPGGSNGSYYSISNGAITSNSSTPDTFYLPVGTVVRRADVPLTIHSSVRDFDATEV